MSIIKNVSILESRVRLLVEERNKLLGELSKSRQEIVDLKKSIEQVKLENTELKNEVLSQGLFGNEGKGGEKGKHTKQLLENTIQEIDRCISVLENE